MKERNLLQEKYDAMQAAKNPNSIHTPNVGSRQKLSRQKDVELGLKVTSIILALALAGTGIGFGISALAKNSDGKDKSSTSDSDNKYDDYDFVLEYPADIDKAKQLEGLIDAVLSNIKKDPKVADTKFTDRMAKFFNGDGRLKLADFAGMSDEQIVKELQSYSVEMLKILSTAIQSIYQIDLGNTKDLPKALAVALTIMDKNGYLSKHYLEKYDTEILNEQIKDIVTDHLVEKNEDEEKDYTQDYFQNAEAFYNITKKMLNDPKININQKAFIALMVKAHKVIFESYLTKDQIAYLDKEFDDSYFVQAFTTILNEFGISSDILDGEGCGEKTTTGAITDKEPADAKDIAGETTTAHDLVEQGGGKSKGDKGKHETVQEPTTDTPKTKDEVVPVSPEDQNRPTEFEPGDKPVEDKNPGQGNSGNSETVTSGGEVLDEEDVSPEEEDFPPIDDDDEIILTGDEFNNYVDNNSESLSNSYDVKVSALIKTMI